MQLKKKIKKRGLPFSSMGINTEIFHTNSKKKITMKKLFIVLAVASLGFVACNSEGETKEGGDTTVIETPAPVDTTVVVPVDTTVVIDTTK